MQPNTDTQTAPMQEGTESQAQPPAITVNPQHYMMFIMLLEAAMRHREAYWRESIADYRSELEFNNQVWKDNYEKNRDPKKQGKLDRGWERRNEAKLDMLVEEFTRKLETFNKSVYAMIDNLTKTYSEEAKKTFEDHATSFSVLCGEMNIATMTKDPAELLVLAKMYNLGQMDNVFKEYRALNDKKEEVPVEDEVKLSGDDLTQKIFPFPDAATKHMMSDKGAECPYPDPGKAILPEAD